MEIIELTENNIDTYGIGCIKNKKHQGFIKKKEWILNEFKNGLKIFMAVEEKKVLGNIEGTLTQNCWRGVAGKKSFLIHCIWVYDSKRSGEGIGSSLIEACEEYARSNNLDIYAVVSEGSWMVGREIFLKRGFENYEEKDRFQLIGKRFFNYEKPKFVDSSIIYSDKVTLFYSHQCPMNEKAFNDLSAVAKDFDVEFETINIESAEKAREIGSIYGNFLLTYQGRILADHYISGTRFKNILKKL